MNKMKFHGKTCKPGEKPLRKKVQNNSEMIELLKITKRKNITGKDLSHFNGAYHMQIK